MVQYGISTPLRRNLGLSPRQPLSEWVTMSRSILRCRVSILVHPFIDAVLRCFDATLFQLTPNSYRYMVEMYIAFQNGGLGELFVNKLVNVYILKKDNNLAYYLSKRRNDINGILRVPNKDSN